MKNDQFIQSTKNGEAKKERPSLDFAFMQFAKTIADRSTCCRKRVGAVFVDKHKKKIISFGYNGGFAHELVEGCDSEKPGACGCVHAEINAVTKNSTDLSEAICYVTLSPCIVCAKVIYNAGISKIYYLEDYRDSSGIDALRKKGLEVIKVDFDLESD